MNDRQVSNGPSLLMRLAQAEFRASCFLCDMGGTLLNSHTPVIRVYVDWALLSGLDPDRVLSGCQGRRVIDTVRVFALPGTHIDADTVALKQFELDDVKGIVGNPERW
ncbi:hypothetical protein [Caballeronia sp. KNU42]